MPTVASPFPFPSSSETDVRTVYIYPAEVGKIRDVTAVTDKEKKTCAQYYITCMLNTSLSGGH